MNLAIVCLPLIYGTARECGIFLHFLSSKEYHHNKPIKFPVFSPQGALNGPERGEMGSAWYNRHTT